MSNLPEVLAPSPHEHGPLEQAGVEVEEQHPAIAVRDMVRDWTYRPPISAHLIDNHSAEPMHVALGPGWMGRTARRISRVVLLGMGSWF